MPKHITLSADEKAELMKRLNITPKQLPRIKEEDPAVEAIGAKKGDILKITRNSMVAGEYIYYRVVV